jgi:hypothetical protein
MFFIFDLLVLCTLYLDISMTLVFFMIMHSEIIFQLIE